MAGRARWTFARSSTPCSTWSPTSTAHDYFALWQTDGTWQRIVDALRTRVRVEAGRNDSPSGALIDSQSVKTTEIGGAAGYDGGKKVKGRNRALDRWLERTAAPYRVEAVATARKRGQFEPQKLRWAVERTIAWIGRCRRLSKDYEYNTEASEAWVCLVAIQQMIRRLRPNQDKLLQYFKYLNKEVAVA